MTEASAKLLQTFRDLDLRVRNSLANEVSPLRLALAALSIAHDEARQEFVSMDELHEALESADVSVERSSLAKGIGRAGKRVTRRKVDGEIQYRLALKGRPEAQKVLGAGDIDLIYIDGTKPRTDRRELGDVLGALTGTVSVCDPYYGVRSLDSLELIPRKAKVRFLTARTNDSATKWAGALKDFKKERPHVELRVAARPQELHDRYVLSDEKILIIGHGLKDFGGKESFVIVLPRTLAQDLLGDVQRSFDQKWAKATPFQA
jgi:hypothetical protein